MAGDGTSDTTSVMKTLREIMQDQHDEAPQPQRENWPAEEKPAKVSLMALLADEDGYSDCDVAVAEEGEGCVEKAAAEGQIESVCCVCMVRNKGAAFIPCGHTFCRLCSRELWVCRGNCPLCNGFIHEILDIF